MIGALRNISAFVLTPLGVGHDWLEIKFTRLPNDLKSYVEQVKNFCTVQ